MDIAERHKAILKKLKQNGKVGVQTLSEDFDVSTVTIRKDLRNLEDKNLLYRTHGGASLDDPYTINRSLSEKKQIKAKEKEAIAKEAQAIIGDNDSLILGSGTTVTVFARHITPDKKLNIITSALNVSLELAEKNNVEVIQLGGNLRPSSSSVVGSYAESFLEEITCGVFFLGVDGIDFDYGITTTNLEEAKLNKRCIETAQTVVLLADSSKFGKRGFGRICDFNKIHHVVTDDGVSDEAVDILSNKGIQVTVAPTS